MENLPSILQYDDVDDSIDVVTHESNPNMVYDDDNVNQSAVSQNLEEQMVDLPTKKEVKVEDIFDPPKPKKGRKRRNALNLPEFQPTPRPDTPPPELSLELQDDASSGEEVPEPLPAKPTTPPPPPEHDPNWKDPKLYTKAGKLRKKRVLTAEHKAKLAAARDRHNQQRKGKQTQLQKSKILAKQKKALLLQQQEMEVQKLQESVSGHTPQKVSFSPAHAPPQHQQYLTKKDLEQATLDAVIKYDTIRKTQKKAKKEKQQVEQAKNELRDHVKKITGWQETAGLYGNCY